MATRPDGPGAGGPPDRPRRRNGLADRSSARASGPVDHPAWARSSVGLRRAVGLHRRSVARGGGVEPGSATGRADRGLRGSRPSMFARSPRPRPGRPGRPPAGSSRPARARRRRGRGARAGPRCGRRPGHPRGHRPGSRGKIRSIEAETAATPAGVRPARSGRPRGSTSGRIPSPGSTSIAGHGPSGNSRAPIATLRPTRRHPEPGGPAGTVRPGGRAAAAAGAGRGRRAGGIIGWASRIAALIAAWSLAGSAASKAGVVSRGSVDAQEPSGSSARPVERRRPASARRGPRPPWPPGRPGHVGRDGEHHLLGPDPDRRPERGGDQAGHLGRDVQDIVLVSPGTSRNSERRRRPGPGSATPVRRGLAAGRAGPSGP